MEVFTSRSGVRKAVAVALAAGGMGLGQLLTTSTALANEANRMLLNSPEAKRNWILARTIDTSGAGKCGTVTKHMFQGQTKAGDALWSVACSSGRSYSISIENDAGGSTKVLDCAVLKAVSGETCFKRY